MAKKKSKQRQRKPAVRIKEVLESVVDELAAVIGVLNAVPEMSLGGADEIAEWARLLKVQLVQRPEPIDVERVAAPAAAARIAAWRIGRVHQLLESLRLSACPS